MIIIRRERVNERVSEKRERDERALINLLKNKFTRITKKNQKREKFRYIYYIYNTVCIYTLTSKLI